jgi:hypothetical protein
MRVVTTLNPVVRNLNRFVHVDSILGPAVRQSAAANHKRNMPLVLGVNIIAQNNCSRRVCPRGIEWLKKPPLMEIREPYIGAPSHRNLLRNSRNLHPHKATDEIEKPCTIATLSLNALHCNSPRIFRIERCSASNIIALPPPHILSPNQLLDIRLEICELHYTWIIRLTASLLIIITPSTFF